MCTNHVCIHPIYLLAHVRQRPPMAKRPINIGEIFFRRSRAFVVIFGEPQKKLRDSCNVENS
jgi:hypothetical protein